MDLQQIFSNSRAVSHNLSVSDILSSPLDFDSITLVRAAAVTRGVP
jgi:hypothetical protein